MLGVLLNKNLNVKYSGDRWKCWICNKSNNSILRDIACPQCGDGSINPHFFGIQTESSNMNCNEKLECGIAKLTVYKNKNNKVCVLYNWTLHTTTPRNREKTRKNQKKAVL